MRLTHVSPGHTEPKQGVTAVTEQFRNPAPTPRRGPGRRGQKGLQLTRGSTDPPPGRVNHAAGGDKRRKVKGTWLQPSCAQLALPTCTSQQARLLSAV